MTGKLPSVKLPPWSENCPPWNCPTEDCPLTNPAPWIWVRVRTRVRVGGNLMEGSFSCTVLNARKHLQSSHSVMLNVIIWQFHNSNCSYSLIAAIFLEEELQTFVLAKVTFGKATFSKEVLFRSTYSLNFLSNYCSFWEQLLLRRSIWSIKYL